VIRRAVCVRFSLPSEGLKYVGIIEIIPLLSLVMGKITFPGKRSIMDNRPLTDRQWAAFMFVLLLFVGSCLGVAWGIMHFQENKAEICPKLAEEIRKALC
jgi:hypothetical protein